MGTAMQGMPMLTFEQVINYSITLVRPIELEDATHVLITRQFLF